MSARDTTLSAETAALVKKLWREAEERLKEQGPEVERAVNMHILAIEAMLAIERGEKPNMAMELLKEIEREEEGVIREWQRQRKLLIELEVEIEKTEELLRSLNHK